MKSSRFLRIVTALFVALAPFVSQATVFFSDTFTNGSTLNSATPANPTSTNTAYEIISAKTRTQTNIAPNQLRFGIANSTSGHVQAQALFSTNAMALILPGDYIQLTVVFTNFSGLLTEAGQLGFGLYNSGQVKPLAGGADNLSTSVTISGGAQNWLGYVGQVNYTGANSRIMTRPSQSAVTTGNNQDLISSGSGTLSFTGASTVGSTVASTVSLTVGKVCTNVLTITLDASLNLAITNILSATNGVLANFGGVATGSTLLTSGFDGFAVGYMDRSAPSSNTIDVAYIEVSGSVTPVSGPPTIDQQPVDVTVPNGGSCAFSVAATGFSVTYQWHRNGTNLLNGGNISGVTSRQLVISPAGPGDVLSGANGYYVTVTGAGPFSTNSETHSLAFGTAKNLIYSGSGAWDLNTSPSWLDTGLNPGFMFNYGDNVTFDDNGAGGTVPLSGSYLSASSVTVDGSSIYTFSGTGSFAGPGSLRYMGSAQFTVNNPNTYTGGTIISNSLANLRLQNLGGLGTGPITFAAAGSKMTVLTASSSSTSINSDLIVADDATIVLDPVNSNFGMVLNGNLSGTAGKTLTINHGANGSGTSSTRIRINGTNTVYNADLNLNDSTFIWSPSPSSGSQTYNGVVSGTGSLLQKSSTTYLNGANTYSGFTQPAAGSIGLGRDSSGPAGSPTDGPIGTGPLLLQNDSTTTLAGSGTIFASGGARTLGNPIQYQSASNNLTLIIGGTNSLTLAGPVTLNGNDGLGAGTNRTFQVDNTKATTISGNITDASLGMGLIKTGGGSLYLDGANGYTGLTTVLNTTTNVGLLAGAGSIAGAVFVQTNAAIGGGSSAAIGTLTINNTLTLNGNGFFRVNRAGLASDQVSVAGVLTNTGTGTITATNLGATLVAGDKFFIFNKALSNGAAMTVTGAGLVWTNNLAVDGSIVAGQLVSADLGIGKSAVATVSPSASFTYTISVTNLGPQSGSSVVVTDALPAGVTFVSATGGGVNNAGVVSWALGTMTLGQVSNLTLNVTAPATGSVTNTASVSSATLDLNSANNTNSPVVTTVLSSTDLAVGKSGPATVNPAANFNYTIMVTNLGPASASSVVVTDTLPAGLTFVSASGGGVNNSGVVNWALGSLNSSQASNLTLTVTAPLYGSITNKALVSSTTTDTNPANDTSPLVVTTVVPVTTRPHLTNSIAGNSLTLQWPLDHTGFTLQSQTNSLTTGLGSNWVPVGGSSTTNQVVIPLDVTKGSVFFRLVYQP